MAGPGALRRVVVVDDHRTFTELLVMALDAHPQLCCVGTARDGSSVLDLVRRTGPDVVVMDYRLGADDGVSVTRELLHHEPDLAVVMLTAYPDRRMITAAADAGAHAVLPKDGALDELIDVVLTAERGRFTVPPALFRILTTAEPAGPAPGLTPREVEVLQLLASGRDVRRIARELSISVNTTRGHVKAILVKLDAHSQLEAVARAHRDGLLATGPST